MTWRASDPVNWSLLHLAAIDVAGCLAFSAISPLAREPLHFVSRHGPPRPRYAPGTPAPLWARSSPSGNAAPPPLPTTEDPFLLLGLDAPTADAQEIKRAYRKRAMQYHPDVVLGSESTAEERDRASKEFARINAAYETLTGGGKGSTGTGGARGSDATSGAKSSSGGYSYQPPHRRKAGYSSSSSGKSTNWEDFMPKYDEEDAKYDAGGDSFGAIFSDMLTGAAGYAAGVSGLGGGGIMGDFIEFLENNMGGIDDDDDNFVRYASFEEVANEMDETDVLVASLETKLSKVQNDLMQSQADLKLATKFSEKLDLEERVAELQAREKVSKDYLKRGKKRLIRLRERYKALVVEGREGRAYGGSSGSGAGVGGANGRSRNSGTTNSAPFNRGPTTSPSSTQTTSNPSAAPAPSPAKSWRNEGFSGSYGGRSSGRRSRRETAASSTSTASRTQPSPSPAPASSSAKSWREEGFSSSYGGRRSAGDKRGRRDADGANSGAPSTAPSTVRTREQSDPRRRQPSEAADRKTAARQYEPFVPPHRRTQSATDRVTEDKKRLRELKVDEDFDKLKRELGL